MDERGEKLMARAQRTKAHTPAAATSEEEEDDFFGRQGEAGSGVPGIPREEWLLFVGSVYNGLIHEAEGKLTQSRRTEVSEYEARSVCCLD